VTPWEGDSPGVGCGKHHGSEAGLVGGIAKFFTDGRRECNEPFISYSLKSQKKSLPSAFFPGIPAGESGE
jgi:hypothetical protein